MTDRNQHALNQLGDWVNAEKTEYKKNQMFWCGCLCRRRVKLRKPSGLLGKRTFRPHFSHIPNKKHADTISVCTSGGESSLHKMAKQILREDVGMYCFLLSYCKCCHNKVMVDSAGGKVDLEVVSSDKSWRYDCLLKIDNLTIALEVVHTHLTSDAKVEATRKSGIEIVEFRAEDVINMKERCELDNIKIKTLEECDVCTEFDKLRMKEERERLELINELWAYEEAERLDELRENEEARRREEEARRREEEERERLELNNESRMKAERERLELINELRMYEEAERLDE
jgi:hypothetical protein